MSYVLLHWLIDSFINKNLKICWYSSLVAASNSVNSVNIVLKAVLIPEWSILTVKPWYYWKKTSKKGEITPGMNGPRLVRACETAKEFAINRVKIGYAHVIKYHGRSHISLAANRTSSISNGRTHHTVSVAAITEHRLLNHEYPGLSD